MNAISMIKRCGRHQIGEAGPHGGYGSDSVTVPASNDYVPPSDNGVEGHRDPIPSCEDVWV